MRLTSNSDAWAGLFFMLLALAAGAMSLQYRLGTPNQMGPGFFPLMLAIVLMALGLSVFITSVRSEASERFTTGELRAAAAVLGSVVLFALILRPAGFFATITLVAFVSQLGAPGFRPLRALLIGAGISVFAYCVFILGLQIRVPLLPSFL